MSETLTAQDAAGPLKKHVGKTIGIAVSLCVAGALFYGIYQYTQRTVSIDINGVVLAYHTHETTGEAVLEELDLSIGEDDVVVIPSDEELWAGLPISITAARDVALVQDGQVTRAYSLGSNLREALYDLGVSIYPNDRFYVNGIETDLYAALPLPEIASDETVSRVLENWRDPIVVNVRRAVPFTVQDGSLTNVGFTSARTVGQALYEQGITVRDGDVVTPAQNEPVTSGMSVTIQRATSVLLDVGGTQQSVYTQADTVTELLEAEGITLGPDDYVLPGESTEILGGDVVNVVRVHDEYVLQEVPVPYDAVVLGDPTLEIDNSQIVDWGSEGAERTLVRVHYVNGQETYRTEVQSWLEREPEDRETHYGTQIVERTLSTPEAGEITYWRVVRMLATSYNAATAGTPPWASWYGYTVLGWRAAKGIVAVDPDVIPLGTQVYVPGYGKATAADTGSAIVDRHIDLCYDDDNLVMWYRWVNVYLLTPVPSASNITWQIPNNPIEKE